MYMEEKILYFHFFIFFLVPLLPILLKTSKEIIPNN